MKFNIDKLTFLKGLQTAQNVADRKSTMPLAANVLLQCKEEKLFCAATNLMVSVLAELEAEVKENGGITCSARTFYDVVKSLPDQSDLEITVETTPTNFAEVKADKVRFQIVGMSDEDFPAFPQTDDLEFSSLDSNVVGDLFTKVFFSILPEETRPHLNAAFMESKEGVLRLVSTDGHRLSKAEASIGDAFELEKPILIPRRGVQEIRRLLENTEDQFEIAVKGEYLFVCADSVTMAVRLNEEHFPPYDEVIPSDLDKKVVVERTAFMDALRRVSLLSAEKTHGIRIRLKKGAMEVLSRNPDLGEANEELDVDFEGEEFVVAFNSRYFVELLSEMDGDEVTIEFGEELDPCLVRPVETSSYLGVIMPLRF
jgi:DNA polymerase-3 subunit beta